MGRQNPGANEPACCLLLFSVGWGAEDPQRSSEAQPGTAHFPTPCSAYPPPPPFPAHIGPVVLGRGQCCLSARLIARSTCTACSSRRCIQQCTLTRIEPAKMHFTVRASSSCTPFPINGWLGGSVARWLGGSVARWLGGSVARWLFGGSVARWLGGSVAGWLGG